MTKIDRSRNAKWVRSHARILVISLVPVTIVAGWAGSAVATSGGPTNSTSLQGCPTNDSAWSYYGSYPGCHNVNLLVQDGSGHTYFEAGTDQTGQYQNLHSGTVMVTPNGDGNPYGDPQGTPPCPDVSGASQAPQPGQQETDQNCQTTPPASPVTGPGAGASVDTNYQPLPASDCAAQSAAESIVSWVTYLAGQNSAPCTAAPVTWSGPTSPLTDNPSQDKQGFSPNPDLSSAASWPGSITPAWTLPSGAPTATPWVSQGPLDTNCASVQASTQSLSGPCALNLLLGGAIYGVGDDNVNTGEHDGMDGQYSSGNTFDGSPDGGGTYLTWQPQSGAQSLAQWPAIIEQAAQNQSVTPLAPIFENPFPLVNFGFGAGFDGPYVGVYTNQETLYQGGGGTNTSSNNQRDIYNYQEPNGQPKDWQPAQCANGSAAGEQACLTQPGSNGQTPTCTQGGGPNDPTCGANYYNQQEASNVTSQPGVMVYNNPDPQSSGSNGTPGAYVGTCGAVVPTGTLGLPAAPSQLGPVASTNSAGQTVAADPTGC
ncbi:MAG TPA: hypothetical protein VND70_01575 [Acidimicrobiales bacterium]|nr:hypothetical protein [Acidimicrobiales bacterium]